MLRRRPHPTARTGRAGEACRADIVGRQLRPSTPSRASSVRQGTTSARPCPLPTCHLDLARLTGAACCCLKAAIPRHRSALWWASTKELRHAQAIAATAVAPRGRGGSHLGGPVQLQAQPGAEPVTRDGGCTHVSTDLAAETPEQAEEAQHQARAAGRGREPVNGSSFTCDAGS
jgi:hypothetical protein